MLRLPLEGHYRLDSAPDKYDLLIDRTREAVVVQSKNSNFGIIPGIDSTRDYKDGTVVDEV